MGYTQTIQRLDGSGVAPVALVEHMLASCKNNLALHKKLTTVTIPPDKQLYQRQIEATDRAIDALVAVRELQPTEVPEGKAGVGYGLAAEEIGIVEGASR